MFPVYPDLRQGKPVPPDLRQGRLFPVHPDLRQGRLFPVHPLVRASLLCRVLHKIPWRFIKSHLQIEIFIDMRSYQIEDYD